MFLTRTHPISIFVFSFFSDVGQIGDISRAIENGDVEMVGRLPLSGVSSDVRTSDEFDHKTLHIAAQHNSTEVAQLLITHKATIKQQKLRIYYRSKE